MTTTNWKLNLSSLPAYVSFKGEFEEYTDAKFIDYMLAQGGWKEHHRPKLVKYRNQLQGNINRIGHYQAKGVGRFYAEEDGSIINLPRIMKHTIMSHCGWMDFDLIKSHPSIVVEYGKRNGIAFPAIERYIRDFEEIIERNLAHYSDDEGLIDEDDIKDYFNSALNGGTLDGWIYSLAHPKEGTPKYARRNDATEDFTEYAKDCKRAIDLIYLNNAELAEKVKGKDTGIEKIKRRTISYWCGAIENDIINIAYKWLIQAGVITARKGAPEYDGYCFRPEKELDWDEAITEINAHIFHKTGIAVRGKFKGYKKVRQDIIDSYRQHLLIPPPDKIEYSFDDGEDEYENAETYADFKKGFEKSHCKVIDKSSFYKIKRNHQGIITEAKIFNKADLIISYEHLTYETAKGTKSYINDWIKDKTIRKYKDVDVIAPPTVCPPDIYNLWTPFRIQQLYDQIIIPDLDSPEYADLSKKANTILQHINILVNEDAELGDYLVLWIGQALLYPAYKTSAPCLISKEGAGKGTIIKFIKKMMGDHKVLETAEPSKYVWGHFNELMLNAYFISLNEMEQREQEEAEGRIKMLIKDPDLQINGKNKGHIKIQSNHRFWYASNQQQPIKSKKDDRRNCIMRLSDKLICMDEETKQPRPENIAYFKRLNEYIEDDRVIKLIYDFFITRPNLDTFHLKPQPITKYQKILQQGNSDPIGEWLIQFTRENWYVPETNPTVEILAKDMSARFQQWRDAHNFKYECNSTGLMRNINIHMINYPDGAITTTNEDKTLHKSCGNMTRFNIALMKTHLGLVEAPTELVAGGGGQVEKLDDDDDGFGEA